MQHKFRKDIKWRGQKFFLKKSTLLNMAPKVQSNFDVLILELDLIGKRQTISAKGFSKSRQKSKNCV